MDRQYTAQFFYGPSGKSFPMGERVAFTEMYARMARVARACRSEILGTLARQDTYMATRATKVIDNAIVGYVLNLDKT